MNSRERCNLVGVATQVLAYSGREFVSIGASVLDDIITTYDLNDLAPVQICITQVCLHLEDVADYIQSLQMGAQGGRDEIAVSLTLSIYKQQHVQVLWLRCWQTPVTPLENGASDSFICVITKASSSPCARSNWDE